MIKAEFSLKTERMNEIGTDFVVYLLVLLINYKNRRIASIICQRGMIEYS